MHYTLTYFIEFIVLSLNQNKSNQTHSFYSTMLTRIVRMTFKPSEVDNFLSLFNSQKEKIRAFPGCNHLELWRDMNHENVFSTYSHWDTDKDLQNYRNSELFAEVWANTKVLFAAKPVAHSHQIKVIV